MKKVTKRIIVALLVGAVMVQGLSAFDFSWGGWGRAGWAPLVVQGGGDPNTTDANDTTNFMGVGGGPGWDAIGAAVGVEVSGQNEAGSIGMQLKMRVNTNKSLTIEANGNEQDFGIGAVLYPNDNTANIWAKPFGDILTLRVGMYQVDDLRGKHGGAKSDNMILGGMVDGEDTLFARFENGNIGAHFKVVPIENLQIHASLGVNTKYGGDFFSFKDGLAAVYTTGQYGLGYTIPDIGFARFQFLGGKYGKNYSNDETVFTSLGGAKEQVSSVFPSQNKDWNLLQLAFQLTAVENLNLDFGLGIPLAIKPIQKAKYDDITGASGYTEPYVTYEGLGHTLGKDDAYQAPINVALAAKYDMGDLGIFFRTDVKFMEKATYHKAKTATPLVQSEVEHTGGLSLAFLIEPSYKLGDIGTVFADIGFKYVGNSTDGGLTKDFQTNDQSDKKDGKMDLGLGISFHRNLGGGGNFSIGVSSTIPLGGDGYSNYTPEGGTEVNHSVDKAKAFKVAVPIILTYSLY